MHISSKSGSHLVSAVLVLAGCDVFKKNKFGQSPLHIACEFNQSDVATVLLGGQQQLLKMASMSPEEATTTNTAVALVNMTLPKSDNCSLHIAACSSPDVLSVICDVPHIDVNVTNVDGYASSSVIN